MTSNVRGVAPNSAPTEFRKVVAMGASAGGLRPLLEVLAVFPKNLPCSVLVATHMAENKRSMMPELLGRICAMPVVAAVEGPLLRGTVHVATPGYHVSVDGRRICLSKSPPIRFLRPNIDLLLNSIGKSFGADAVGVVLSGMGRDGAEGLRALKHFGGTTIVEDPETAEFPEMPRAALRTGCVDIVLSSDRIGELLIQLCTETPSLLNG